jgi:SpoVK/Ycf46/Vps4 family AAA+-type ATPase
MARGDLLVKLFKSFKNGDDHAFLEAASTVIDDEEKKHHNVLANELKRILNGSLSQTLPNLRSVANTLPRDTERGTDLVDIKRPDRYFQDLILSRHQLEPIQDVLTEFRQREILEANGLKPRTKLLFCGPPGCGKTATAEAIATELGLPLLYVRFDSVVSSLLGETASNLRKIFDFASRGIWVLFFDEFDAIGRSRDDSVEHGELKRVVNTFLQLLDNFRGNSLIISATNFEQVLDPALWRRFDEIVRFDKPDEIQVQRILEKFFTGRVKTERIFTEQINSFIGLTHAEIERICLDALRKMTLRGSSQIDEDDILKALSNQQRRKQALILANPHTIPQIDVS